MRYVACELHVVAFEVENGFATSGKMAIEPIGTASNLYNINSINGEMGVGDNGRNQKYESAWGWEYESNVWN